MGKTHIDALKDSSQVVVTATVDPRPEVRKDLEEQGLATFATVDDLLNDGLVDGVLIAAPTDLHRELISVMAGAGIPALCEKPCGVNTSEASACVAITEQVGVPFQIAYWRRYVGALAQLRDRIQSGELGDVLAIQCEQWDESPPPPAFRQRSGGIFVDMGVHEFDQIRWLTGQEFDTVKAVTSGSSMTGPRPDDPDCAQVVASLSGGAT